VSTGDRLPQPEAIDHAVDGLLRTLAWAPRQDDDGFTRRVMTLLADGTGVHAVPGSTTTAVELIRASASRPRVGRRQSARRPQVISSHAWHGVAVKCAAGLVALIAVVAWLRPSADLPVVGSVRGEAAVDGRPLLPGRTLRAGETVRVGDGGALSLVWADGTVCELRAASAAAVTNGWWGGKRLDLIAGAVTADVAHQRQPMQIAAGRAQVTVLGTEFELSRSGAGADLAMRAGTVSLDAGVGAPLRVEGGWRAAVGSAGAATSPLPTDWLPQDLIRREITGTTRAIDLGQLPDRCTLEVVCLTDQFLKFSLMANDETFALTIDEAPRGPVVTFAYQCWVGEFSRVGSRWRLAHFANGLPAGEIMLVALPRRLKIGGTAAGEAERLSVRRPAAASAPTAPAGSTMRINFQPAWVSVPAGYLADSGAGFGARDGGLSYGWNRPNLQTRSRLNPRSPDARHDTLTHFRCANDMRCDGLWWEIAVPVGDYEVRAVCGDPDNENSRHRLLAEGLVVVDGAQTAEQPWLDGRRRVRVTDGRLTVGCDSLSRNTKLSFLHITPLSGEEER